MKRAAFYTKTKYNCVQFGEPAQPGKRSDINHLVDVVVAEPTLDLRGLMAAGVAPGTIARTLQFTRELQLECVPPRKPAFLHEKAKAIFYYGDSNTGKSTEMRRYIEQHHPGSCYTHISYQNWWDNYSYEEVVTFEEFTGQIQPAVLNNWVDVHPCKVPVKGSMRQLTSKVFLFTSNTAPWDLWPNCQSDRNGKVFAFLRRLKIYHAKGAPYWNFERIHLQEACRRGNITIPPSFMPHLGMLGSAPLPPAPRVVPGGAIAGGYTRRSKKAPGAPRVRKHLARAKERAEPKKLKLGKRKRKRPRPPPVEVQSPRGAESRSACLPKLKRQKAFVGLEALKAAMDMREGAKNPVAAEIASSDEELPQFNLDRYNKDKKPTPEIIDLEATSSGSCMDFEFDDGGATQEF